MGKATEAWNWYFTSSLCQG